jgi:hypothetical protein
VHDPAHVQRCVEVGEVVDRRAVAEVNQHSAAAAGGILGHDGVHRHSRPVPTGERHPVPGVDVLRAQPFGEEGRDRRAIGPQHSVATLVLGAGPVHLGVDVAAHEPQEGGDVEGGPEDGMVEAGPNVVGVVGVGVQLAADVRHRPIADQFPDRAGPRFVVTSPGHEQRPIAALVRGRAALTQVAPVGVAVPVDEAHQSGVDLVEEPPHPVHPEGLKALHRRSTESQWLSVVSDRKPRRHRLGHRLVHPAVLLEAQPTAHPVAVGLVPHAPVPVRHNVRTPLLDATPDDISALTGEPAQRAGIVDGTVQLREGDHRRGAQVQHRLDIGGEGGPLLDRVGCALVEEEEAHQARVDLPKALADHFPMGAGGEVGALVGLVHPVPHAETLTRHAVRGHVSPPRSSVVRRGERGRSAPAPAGGGSP